MGEYAKFNGQEIKIGTCEDMYYLRFQQRHEVQTLRGNVDLKDSEVLQALRFRFPFPEEDRTEPGAYDSHEKSARVPDSFQAGDIKHHSMQFSARNGYLVSLPCPESEEGKAFPHKIHKNGYGGAVHLVAQKLVGAELWPVCRCGGCGAMWRLPKEDGLALAQAFTDEAQGNAADHPEHSANQLTIARRILDGYTTPAI